MRHKTFLLVITFIAFIATVAFAQTAKQPTSPKPPATQKQTQSKPERILVPVEEYYIFMFLDEPLHQFHTARESFFKKEMKASAAEIRKAAAFLKLEEGRATEEGRKGLKASVDELEKLAGAVEKESVSSVKELDQTFARAHLALAKHHQLKAAESWVKKDANKAGQDLKAASVHFEHALNWGGHEFEAGAKRIIKDADHLAGKLIEGIGWVPDEVGKGVEDVGKEIDKLGLKLEKK